MEVIVKLNSQTAGRDKLVRLLQYASKALGHLMVLRRNNGQLIDQLKSLEYTFSSFRKLLRLGRFLDTLYGSLSLLHYPDIVVRVTCILSKIANALFLFADHILWIGRTGMLAVDSDKWNNIANKYWLYSITMNLVRDIYEIYRIVDHANRLDVQRRRAGSSAPGVGAVALALRHKDILVDTVKNACDVFIPLTALGHTRLSAGTIGALGVVSSLAAIVSLVDPLAKMTPA